MKKIYANFLNGLSSSERNAREGSFYQGENLDPHRTPGFIRPGWAESDKTTPTTTALSDAVYDPDDTTKIYACGGNRLYELTSVGTVFTADANWPQAVDNTTNELFFYHIGAARKLFYISATDMGMCVPATPTFDDDWLSTTPAGAGALQDAVHPKIEWKSYIFIGNGRYVARLDGQTGANGTVDLTKLDLGEGWEVTSLFSTENYIGVCAYKPMGTAGGYAFKTECKIFMWDGSSTTFDYFIPIEDNKIMASYNHNGKIYFATGGKGEASDLKVLTATGLKLLKTLSFDIDGTKRNFTFSPDHTNLFDIFENRLVFGCNAASYGVMIFAYGATDPKLPQDVICQPYHALSGYGVASTEVYFVKQLYIGSLHASFSASAWQWMRFKEGNSTHAKLKMPYTDLGQRVKVNYVKFYFKPLESGDDLAVGIDYDYGTAQSLGTIQYATDGAITSKLFRKGISGTICDNFRPTIVWTAGGVQISKIVVDFSFIGD